MSNTTGTIFRYTVWGQSHAPAIGVTIEGIPAGTMIDLDRLQAFLDRRRPGQNALTTARREADVPEFLSGFTGGAPDGITQSGNGSRTMIAAGCPLTAVIRNSDQRSSDYEGLRYIPRPGHADFPAMIRYGQARDYAGGGQFSGRMTAPVCIAGGIALQILERRGIRVSARPVRIGGETDPERMRLAVEQARADGDSVGGIVECVVEGMPAGIGEPMFDGIENRIAQAVFGIPAVKGIEFGSGFAGADLRGSENNDEYFSVTDTDSESGGRQAHAMPIRTEGNHHGGILGGLSSGMPIVFRAAFKPTPSISKEQDSVDIRTGKRVKMRIQGRHDPCIVLRALPAVEAAAAAALYDLLLIRETAFEQKGV